MEPLIHAYTQYTDQCERIILTWFSVNWKPTSGFDNSNRTYFDYDTDIDKIPTRNYFLVPLKECLIPLIIYIIILLFGHIILLLKRKCKSSTTLIPSSILYYFKFLYNFCQIFLCSYMFIESLILGNRNNLNWLPYDGNCVSFNFLHPRFHNLVWLFYVSKMFDFFDTIFIIFGNKYSQFTFLHQYHHITIYLVYYLNINIGYDSDQYFTITLNTLIHSIMYTYYLISMHIPKIKDNKTGKYKYNIWWKKYLTSLQMIQFTLMNIQALLIIFYGCRQIPPRLIWFYFIYILSLFAMFMNFYKKTYKITSVPKKSSKQKKRN